MENNIQGRKVFLDVGGHLGQTLDEVLSPEYGFDIVHCFEPLPKFAMLLQAKYQAAIANGRLQVHAVGLADQDGEATLFGNNEGGGASLFSEHASNTQHPGATTIRLMRASRFFETELRSSDVVLMKLNCEGAEGQILCDLCSSGEIHKISNVMIDFDLFKVRGRRAEPFAVLEKLKQANFSRYELCYDVMIGKSHQERIRNWLSVADSKLKFVANQHYFDGAHRTRPLLRRLFKRVKWRVGAMLDR